MTALSLRGGRRKQRKFRGRTKRKGRKTTRRGGFCLTTRCKLNRKNKSDAAQRKREEEQREAMARWKSSREAQAREDEWGAMQDSVPVSMKGLWGGKKGKSKRKGRKGRKTRRRRRR